jgi:hypothetical protein
VSSSARPRPQGSRQWVLCPRPPLTCAHQCALPALSQVLCPLRPPCQSHWSLLPLLGQREPGRAGSAPSTQLWYPVGGPTTLAAAWFSRVHPTGPKKDPCSAAFHAISARPGHAHHRDMHSMAHRTPHGVPGAGDLGLGCRCGAAPAGSRGEVKPREPHAASRHHRWRVRGAPPLPFRIVLCARSSEPTPRGLGLDPWPHLPPARPPHVHALHATAQR